MKMILNLKILKKSFKLIIRILIHWHFGQSIIKIQTINFLKFHLKKKLLKIMRIVFYKKLKNFKLKKSKKKIQFNKNKILNKIMMHFWKLIPKEKFQKILKKRKKIKKFKKSIIPTQTSFNKIVNLITIIITNFQIIQFRTFMHNKIILALLVSLINNKYFHPRN